MTIFGTDMSHYDASPSNLGDKLVSQGFAFATHKIGGDANDTEANAFWNAVKSQAAAGKLLVGGYWVLYPGNGAARADAFCDRLDSVCPGWGDVPFILQLDCEQWNGDPGTVPSKSDIKACCDRLRVRAPKLMPIVYAPKWVYGHSLRGLGYPLWASSYVSGSGAASKLYPGDSSAKWGAYSGQVPAVLQFTSSATIAGQTTCDANAFRGTLAELTKLVAPGWVAEEEDNMADMTPAEFVALLQDSGVRKALATAVYLTDGVLPAPTGSTNADGTPNTEWTAWGFATNTYSKAVAIRGAQYPIADIVTAVMAALPPAAAGGLTLQQVEQAVETGTTTVLVKLNAAIAAELAQGVSAPTA